MDLATSRAARFLLDHWQEGRLAADIPEAFRPQSRQAAYAAAEAIGVLAGDAVAGWKIAATSEAGQKHINVDGPLAGRIYASKLVAPGSEVAIGGNNMKVAEAEFAFSFGHDLPARGKDYSRDEVMGAIDHLRLSLEVPDSRFEDFTKAGADQLIADTACACWLSLGDNVTYDWRALDLTAHRVVAFRNGTEAGRGSGANVLGDPLVALTWLANEAARYCGGVKAGQFVTTGTCVPPVAVQSGDSVEMNFGVLGTIRLSFA
jgi:2-keto-4-pentenoate hydratase